MLDVAKAAPWFEGVHAYYGAAFVVAVLTISKITGFTRWARKKWVNWRNWILVRDGAKAVPNVRPALVALPQRLEKIDEGQLEILRVVDEYKTEHTVEVGKIAEKVDQVLQSNKDLVTKVQMLFPNGDNTNQPGDLLSRTAKAVGAFLPNPEPVSHDRREGDDKAS